MGAPSPFRRPAGTRPRLPRVGGSPPRPPPLSRDLPYSLLSPWLTISPLVVVFRHFGFEPLSPLLSFRVVRALEKDAYIATLRALHFQKQSAADALVSALLSTFHPRRRR